MTAVAVIAGYPHVRRFCLRFPGGVLFSTVESPYPRTHQPMNSLQDLAGGRPDPRLFRFPNSSAGVLLEATGDFYQLVQVDGN